MRALCRGLPLRTAQMAPFIELSISEKEIEPFELASHRAKSASRRSVDLGSVPTGSVCAKASQSASVPMMFRGTLSSSFFAAASSASARIRRRRAAASSLDAFLCSRSARLAAISASLSSKVCCWRGA